MFRLSFSALNTNLLLAQALQHCASDNIEEWERKIWAFIAQWLDETVLEITVTTSGSTGLPKSIRHRKSAMRQSAINTINAIGLSKKDTALLVLPADKIGGMMMVARAIILEIELVCIMPTANPWATISALKEVSFLACTPMQLATSFEHEPSFQSANQIANILLGGGPITSSMAPHLAAMTNNVYHTFGMTETISHIALKKISGTKTDHYFTTIGNTAIQQDKRQCLILHSPDLGINNLVTNDVVNIITPNTFEWLGRWDNVINSGGIKIYPEWLEEKLSKKITAPFFIFSKPDELTGERLCMAIELAYNSDEIQNAISHLPKHSQPKEVHFLDKMIYNTSDKIDRQKSLSHTVLIMAL